MLLHQRKLIDAIHRLRKIKIKQRKLTDSASALIDVVKLHNELGDTIEEARESQNLVTQRIDTLEEKLKTLQQTVDSLPDLLIEKLSAAMSRSGGTGLLNRSVSNYEFQSTAKRNSNVPSEHPNDNQRVRDAARRTSNSGASLSSSNIWFLQNPRS